jgi:DNA (cytosine-5)-methyltransferase 1
MNADIRARRLHKKLPQKAVAEEARIPLNEFRKIERGLMEPSDAQYRDLATILETDVDRLRSSQRAFMTSPSAGEGYATAKSAVEAIFERRVAPPEAKWKVLDLFCGCGGLSYGFEQSGDFVVTAGLDLLPDRIATFQANHPYATSIVGDLRKFSAAELSELASGPDIVVGGPPCQGFSSIRPFRALTEGDPRNTLPEEFVAIVGALRPRWFLLENVVGLLTHERGQPFQALLNGFKDAGYTVDWRVINMALLGLPQARERLVIVGSISGHVFPWPQPTHRYEGRGMAGKNAMRLHIETENADKLLPPITVMEAIGDLPPVAAGERADDYTSPPITAYARAMRSDCETLTLHEATAHSEKMMAIIRLAGANRRALPSGMTSSGFSSCYSRLDADRPSTTLTVNFVHPASNRCIHPRQDRALTPREGARLQSFPDDFAFVGGRAQIVKQIGNAVPPLLGRSLAEQLAAALRSEQAQAAA